MKIFCLRNNEKSNKLQNKENKIYNRIDKSINSLNRVNSFYTCKMNNDPNYSLNSISYNNNRKKPSQLKPSNLTKILGKINKEFYKNKNIYNVNLSKCIKQEYLKTINNNKINDNSSNNIQRNYSLKSINNKPHLFKSNDERKNNDYFYDSNNKVSTKQILIRENLPFEQNYNIIPKNNIHHAYSQKYIKNKISNFILKNRYAPNNIIINLENDFEEEKNNKIISLNKSNKRNNSKSNNRSKRNISSPHNNLLIEKNYKDKNDLSNPKNLNNMRNFYIFWTDNDGHMGGKINLALNNSYRNKIDFYSSLYYIIKIQSVWKGHKLRKNLLRKKTMNPKLNIFYKQKLVFKTLFFLLSYKYKKHFFLILKEKINIDNFNKMKGYDINSSLLNNISNCYQKFCKTKTNQNNYLNHNLKRLNEEKINLKLYNNNFRSEINTLKIKKYKTKLNSYYDNNSNNNINTVNNSNKPKNEYKILKTHALSYNSHPKKIKEDNNEENKDLKEKEKSIKSKVFKNRNDKKYIYILPDNKSTTHFTIHTKNKKKECKNIKNFLINPINKEIHTLNKYKEYIYFLFLLFARIQNSSHRDIFNKLIKKLKEKAFMNLYNIKKYKILKIIKNNEIKKVKFYFNIYKEKIIIERVKNILLKENNLYKFNDININNQFHSNTDKKNNKYYNHNNTNGQRSKKYIRIKKFNRSTSVNQSLRKNNSYFISYNYYSFLSKSSSISPKKMIIRQRTNYFKPKNLGEYYELSPEYLLKSKVRNIFKKFDKKELTLFFRRWKNKKYAKKKKKFLIYFIMMMKEYFCNDISIKTNQEYAIGKSMFFWYRKTFY